MPRDDTTRTTLRLPRDLYAEIEKAAAGDGLTITAEMILRLRRDPRTDYAEAILAEIRRRDEAIVDGLVRQNEVLKTALDRADEVLERVTVAMARVSGEGQAAALKRDIELARELIDAVRPDR